MTLLELFKLVKHYALIVLVIPIVCLVACFLVLSVLPASYEATAQLNLSGEPGSIGALAKSAQSSVDMQDTSVSIKPDTTAKTVAITVAGSNAEACVSVANNIAEKTVADAATMYENVKVSVKQADSAVDKSPNKAKYSLAALLAGLFLALCAIVLIDMMRASIKDTASLQALTDLPVLATLPALDGGERLLANVRFASQCDNLQNICVVPVGINSTAPATCVTLAKAMEAEGSVSRVVDVAHGGSTVASGAGRLGGAEVQCCQSLASGMAGMYAAKKADAVVVTVRQWKDSLHDLEDTLQELSLAQANVAGLVLVK